MTLRFDGIGAGLGFRSPSGDRNDPVNYTLMCAADCGVVLGPLARFRVVNEEGAQLGSALTYQGSNRDAGLRFARCMRCGRGIVVRGTQVVNVIEKHVLEAKEAELAAKKKAESEARAKGERT